VANKINLTISVNDDGSLQVVAANAKKATAALNQTAAATSNIDKTTQQANKSRNAFNKLEKGTGQLTNNSTKAFSKQAQTIGGTLVPVYATLAANIFALTAAFGALSRAAATQQLAQGLIEVGSAAGQNLPKVAEDLKRITGFAISTQAAMSAVALGTSAGFNSSQLEGLTKVAKGASLALGRDMEDALTRLVKGTAKLEPEILDELGILVRLDTAATNYAVTLGKQVTQLTEFERRQAFLNETLKQGLAKFGEIADTIDPNQFNQLAASFDNMTKIIFKGLNYVLGPVAKFLSNSWPALAGAMLLFGSTIISKLVPALDELAEGQLNVARQASIMAKDMDVAALKKYEKAVKGISNWDIMPPSIKAQKEAYENGSRSVKDMTKDLKQLQNSESLRSAHLATYKKQLVDLNSAQKSTNADILKGQLTEIRLLKEKIALKETELAQNRATQAQVKNALVLGGQAGGTGSAAALQAGKTDMANRQAATFAALQGQGLISTLKITGAAMAAHYAQVTAATGATVKFGLTMRATALSAGLLGRALLSMIPILGQILLIGSLLYPLFSKLWEKSAVAKQTAEVVKGFESLDAIGRSLSNTLESNKSDAEKLIATYRVQVGVMNQLASGIKSIQDAKEAESTKEITALLTEKYRIQQMINKGSGAGYLGMEDSPKTMDAMIKRVGELNSEITSIRGTINDLNIEQVVVAMDAMLGRIESLGVTTGFEIAIAGITKLKALAESGTVGNKELNAELVRLLSPIESVVFAIDNSSQAVASFNKEVVRLSSKNQTPYDDIISAFKAVKEGAVTARQSGERELEAYFQKNEEFRAKLIALWQKEQPGVMTAPGLFELYVTLLKLSDSLDKTQEQILRVDGTVKQLTARAKVLSEIAKDNPLALKGQLDLENEALSEQIKKYDMMIAQNGDLEKNLDNTAHIYERQALQTKLALNLATEEYQVSVARVAQEQRLLSYEVLQNNAAQESLKANQAIAALKLKSASSAGNQDVSPVDALRLFKEQEEDRKKGLLDAYVLKVRGIALEYQLLDAQTRLEMAKAQTANQDTKVYDEYLSLLSSARNSSVAAAGASLTADTAGIGGEKDALTRAVAEQTIAQANERSANAVERLRVTGAENASLALEMTNNLENQKRLEEDISELKVGDLDRSTKELEVAKLKIQYQALEIANLMKFAEVSGRLAGEGFGIASGFAAQLALITPTLENTEVALSEKMGLMAESMNPFLDQLSALGPEGEVMSAVFEGTFAMTEAFTMAFEEINKSGLTMQTGLMAAAATVNALASIQAAQSRSAIAGIDSQIAAERARDGKSAESVAKIAALEKKQESIKRKAFEKDKKMKMASVVINTAAAVMATLAQTGWWAIPLAVIVGAMGAAQLAVIAGTSYEGGSAGGTNVQPSKVSVGERTNVVDLATARSPAGEVAYSRGEQGTGNGMGSFIPNAFTGRNVGANTGVRVGEQGAEIFVPKVPGRIIPADDAARVGSTSNVTFQINAIDAKGVEEVLRAQRSNIINMLRQAANDRGEFFMENVA